MTEPDAAPDFILVHATCVALGACGVLLRGPSGSGKSDLALQLIDLPGFGIGQAALAARLVADDQVMLTRAAGRLMAAPPPRLAGLLEIRGLGIVNLQKAGPVPLGLVVDLAPVASIGRYPVEVGEAEFLGCRVPVVSIDATVPSAAARVRAAMAHLVRKAPLP